MPKGEGWIGMLGIGWAIIELQLVITISRTAHVNTEVFKGVFWSEGGLPSHLFLYQFKNHENPITLSRSYSFNNVWINRPLMPFSDVTTLLL